MISYPEAIHFCMDCTRFTSRIQHSRDTYEVSYECIDHNLRNTLVYNHYKWSPETRGNRNIKKFLLSRRRL